VLLVEAHELFFVDLAVLVLVGFPHELHGGLIDGLFGLFPAHLVVGELDQLPDFLVIEDMIAILVEFLEAFIEQNSEFLVVVVILVAGAVLVLVRAISHFERTKLI
jgi:hypothetical protein